MPKEKYSVRNKTRFVSIEDGRIVFTVLRDGVKDYADYDDTLYKILTMNQLRPFRHNGRLKFNVCADCIDHTFYIYDLAMACYRGMVKEDTFLEDLQRYYDYKSSNGLSIDHADNNIHNNTRLNITLMDKGVLIPQVAILGNILKQKGFPISKIPVTEKQAVEVFSAALKGGNA